MILTPTQMAAHAVAPSSQRQLDLVEWGSLDVSLSSTEIAELLRCPSKVFQIQTLPGGMCRLQCGPVVGRLQFGTVDVRILPKYPMPSLLAMLAEVHELAQLTPQLVGYDTSPEVVDLLVQIFLGQVERVVRQGLRRTYIEEDEELVAVRGRIDLRRTVDLHLRGKAKAQCRYEDFTLDGPENGTLLAALRAITAARMLPVVRRNVGHRAAAEFVGVRPRFQRGADPVAFDRLNQHYHPALQLAQLILECMGVTQDFGMTEADGFMLNMNQLFERFVERRLRKLLTVDGIQVRAQKQSSFDVLKQSAIQPDLLIQSRHGQRVVADTKYKVGTKPDPSDLYQMLTYCRVLNIANGVLFTVGTGQLRRYEVLDGVTTIEVIPVDLDGTVSDIDKSLLILASRVTELLTDAT
ncbi:MAG: hypothetical protein WD049_10215 [Candidatus Paceibacterota bacterium]